MVFAIIGSSPDMITNNEWMIIPYMAISAAVFTLLSSILAFPLTGSLSNRWIDIRFRKRHPSAALVNALFALLLFVERNAFFWPELPYRKRILNELEDIAFQIQHYLPKILRTGDANTQRWFQGVTVQMAEAVRIRKKMVCSPDSRTRGELIEDLSKFSAAAALGNYSEFEKVSVDRKSAVKKLVSWAIRLLRTIWISGLPLLILWLVQKTTFRISGEAFQWTVVAGIAWFSLSLLFFLDPTFPAKVKVMKKWDRPFRMKHDG